MLCCRCCLTGMLHYTTFLSLQNTTSFNCNMFLCVHTTLMDMSGKRLLPEGDLQGDNMPVYDKADSGNSQTSFPAPRAC